jgi:hypothetical protein
MKQRLTVEIEFDTDLVYPLKTSNPGDHGYMKFEEDGIHGHDGLDFPWKLLKCERI